MALVAIVGFGTSSAAFAQNCNTAATGTGSWYTYFDCGNNGSTAVCIHISGIYQNCCVTGNSVVQNATQCVRAYCSPSLLSAAGSTNNCNG